MGGVHGCLNHQFITLIIPQCNRGRSLDAFFDGIQSDPVKLAVVGCGCSPATEPVAEISHQWNISQVIYSMKLQHISS